MSPEMPLFGRITVGANRTSLGRGGFTTLFIRAAQQLRKLRPSDDAVIQIELSRNHLPDSTTFDKLARAEQQFAERVTTANDSPSPWPGITTGRVAQIIATPEYEAYAAICEPDKRIGIPSLEIARISGEFFGLAPEAFGLFPRWVD